MDRILHAFKKEHNVFLTCFFFDFFLSSNKDIICKKCKMVSEWLLKNILRNFCKVNAHLQSRNFSEKARILPKLLQNVP